MRSAGFHGFAAILAVGLANAQSTVSQNRSSSAGFSSSNDSSSVQLAESVASTGLAALPSAPTPAPAAAGQETAGGGWRHSLVSKYALEFGGGFNAPIDKNYITWGAQFTMGGGVNFSKRFALLAEYQFIDDKLPGKLIAETGATGGHAHIWSLTLDPVVSLFPKSENDVYITGGGGFYRKVTSFTDVLPAQFCDFYYCGVGYTPQVVGHFSSNQGGFNIGGGYQHRMGGMYGDSKMKLFAEVRYVDALTPAVTTQPNGLGTTSVAAGTKVIPISLGIRW
ncbi:MAG TPA: hypothetical protein VGT08_05620 [Terracidiphilus sp.]|nr:hypothetical protein [Terracidiphilus sp.]